MIDDRSQHAYLYQNSTWNFDDSIHFPTEIRSTNLNKMVSNLVDEHYQYGVLPTSVQQQTDQYNHYPQQEMKNNPSRRMKVNCSSFSHSGYSRNISDLYSIHHHHHPPPKDIQVLIRKGDCTGANSLIRNVSLQQFRQMIGLQRSSGSTTINDRRNRHNSHLNHSSLSSTNLRVMNAFKQQQENKKLNQQWSQDHQQIYPKQNLTHDFMTKPSIINDGNLTSDQEMIRTSVANILHLAIEKCYEQLNYIRDSYAETESKIGLQILYNPPSLSSNFGSLSNNSSRVDRLIAEYHYEYNRVIHLHDRLKEDLSIPDIETTGQTLDEWLNAINIVRDQCRPEIVNVIEKCHTGETCLSDEKDVLQLVESLRILRITTRKIRTILWYWLYWSTNSTTHKLPLVAHYQTESSFDGKNDNLFYTLMGNELFGKSEHQEVFLKNEDNKENKYNE